MKNREMVLYDEIRLDELDKKNSVYYKGLVGKVELLYRRLKQKYTDEHDWSEVSNWHFREKEMCRKGSLFRRYFPLSLSNLYCLSCGYGERPVRATGVFLGLIVFFLGLSFLTPFTAPTEAKYLFDDGVINIHWTDRLLTTLQYVSFFKDPVLRPEGRVGEWVFFLARILVPLQLGFLVLALRNRFRR